MRFTIMVLKIGIDIGIAVLGMFLLALAKCWKAHKQKSEISSYVDPRMSRVEILETLKNNYLYALCESFIDEP